MSLINLIKTSFFSLKSHKLRVFLTMIGIIIGISSVILILSIGNGLKAEVNKTVQDTDANKVNLYYEAENVSLNTNLIESFNEADLDALEKIDGVEKVLRGEVSFAGMNLTPMEAKYFDKTTVILLDKYKDTKLDILYGESFKGDEGKNIVLSFETAKQLFKDEKESIGKAVTVNSLNYEVIGVLKEAGVFSLSGNSCLISKTNFDEMNVEQPISSINVYIEPGNDREKVIEALIKQLKLNHVDLKGEYKVQDPEEITKAFEKIIGGLTMFIACVTGISLFVGGIGVMNIMYVSVSERKREIGIRRAIGAKPKSILLQFLFEAVIVTGIGGLVGILCGYLLGKLAGMFLPFAPVLTVGSFVGATITSVIVGIVFGIIPAINASKMDPIKAIYM